MILRIAPLQIPETIEFDGAHWRAKREFHVTMLNTETKTLLGNRAIAKAKRGIEFTVKMRDEVIPIVDLRDRLFPRAERSDQPLVLITHSSAGMIGLKVDEVRRIVGVPSDALLPPPPIVRGVRGELLVAVVPFADEVYLLIDLESVLTADEKAELQQS